MYNLSNVNSLSIFVLQNLQNLTFLIKINLWIYNKNKNTIMEYLRLDELEKEVKVERYKIVFKWIIRETAKFLFFVLCVATFGVIFINLTTFVIYFKDKFNIWTKEGVHSVASVSASDQWLKTSFSANVIWWNIIWYDGIKSELDTQNTTKYLKALDSKFSNIKVDKQENIYEYDMGKYLKDKTKKYKFNFNLTPPDNRIIIAGINVDAPIVDIYNASPEKIAKADYDGDLYKWVVRYPDTAKPWDVGNVLIFGHTSYYWWKKNPYWEVFSKIPQLTNWMIITILREWKTYDYEIIDKFVKSPSQVQAAYNSYSWWKYLILMWCYPIWTDSRRMMIIAKQINPYLSMNN